MAFLHLHATDEVQIEVTPRARSLLENVRRGPPPRSRPGAFPPHVRSRRKHGQGVLIRLTIAHLAWEHAPASLRFRLLPRIGNQSGDADDWAIPEPIRADLGDSAAVPRPLASCLASNTANAWLRTAAL